MKEIIEKEKIQTAEGWEIEEKEKEEKIMMMEKGSRETRCLIEGHPCLVVLVYECDNNAVSQRFVEKFQLPPRLPPNQARIKFSTRQCVKEVLCDIAPTNSCHLLLRQAWLHFKTINLDERSLYLRDEGHGMKLKFMKPRQASQDQHRLKEKIEKKKYKLQKEGKLKKKKRKKR